MRFSIEHETRLEFSSPVYEHHCELRLSPRPDYFHRVLSAEIEVDVPVSFFKYTDVFGNSVQTFDILKPHQSLLTRLKSDVETLQTNPFDYTLLPPKKEEAWFRARLREDPLLWQYIVHRSPAVPEWSTLDLTGMPTPPDYDRKQSLQPSLLKALDWSATAIRYQPGTSHTHSSLQEVLTKRSGVCQDFAHLLIALVRSWGVPARYVMGYMAADVENYDATHDDEASHAWAEVLIPGAGWRGFDATNRLCANDLYIPMTMGRDYLDAAPQRGTFKGLGARQTQKVKVTLHQQETQPPVPISQQQQSAQ